MFWTYLDYWIYVTIILKQNSMLCFLKKKKKKKHVKFEFEIYILTSQSIFFAHSQNFLNDMNNKWSEGKHSRL